MPKIFSEEDRDIIKKKLLDIGLEKIKIKRYQHISLDEITSEVGIAKGTFYRFFLSKEAYFYEIMQLIKAKNRQEMKESTTNGILSKEKVKDSLFRRYCDGQTIYDYFTPEDMRLIERKLPNGGSSNDSVEFAEELLSHIDHETNANPKVIVNMCNVLALTATNKDMLEKQAYSATMKLLVDALADYIFE